MTQIKFFVHGIPQPGGSKRAFVIGGKARITDANAKAKPWKQQVSAVASVCMTGKPLMEGPLRLEMTFYFQRPKHHYRTGRHAHLLKESIPMHHTVRPDATKLIRAAEDALTGIVWRDDSQVAEQYCEKLYVSDGHPGMHITVSQIEEFK